MPAIVTKVPAETFDQEIDWSQPSRELGDDTIASSTWTYSGDDTALTLSPTSIGSPATNTTVWISGGSPSAYYTVTNTVTTTAGRILTDSFIVSIIEQRYQECVAEPSTNVSGTVTTTGLPNSGNLAQFAGASSITNGDLSGDVNTSGTLVTTVQKVNGVAYGTSPATNTVPVVTSTNTVTYETVPNAALANSSVTVSGHSLALGGALNLVARDVGLDNVTNDSQTKAAVVPNTTPTAAQILVGNAGGTAYTPVSMSGDATITSAGVVSLNLSNPHAWTRQQYFSGTTLTDASSIAWDANANQVSTVTLGGNRTLANPTNLANGGTYILIVKQDATGSRTLAYGSDFKWPGGTAPTLSSAANAVDILAFVSDGANMYGTAQLAFA